MTSLCQKNNQVTKEVGARMMIALDSGDPELIVDLGQLRPGRYNEFWSKLGDYLEEHVAAQERRHGNIGYMLVACCVPDLIGEIKGIQMVLQFPQKRGCDINSGPRTPVPTHPLQRVIPSADTATSARPSR